jgi:acyl-coenzyme A thioesterase PaaI-like protein
MTARLEVRYRRPLPLGEPLEVSAEVVRDRGRWLEAKGRLRVVSGPLVAEARGVFIRLPAEKARQMEAFYLAGGRA